MRVKNIQKNINHLYELNTIKFKLFRKCVAGFRKIKNFNWKSYKEFFEFHNDILKLL